MRLSIVITLLLLAPPAAVAWGQTTQPAGSAWDAQVREFAGALVSGDKVKVAGAMNDRAEIKAFGADQPETLDRLQARALKGTLIAAHGYQHPPLAMAADLAADAKAAAVLPDELRRKMVPEDDDQMKRANATAVQWVTDVLQPQPEQPVGLIVLWCEDPTAPRLAPGVAAAPQLVFLLLKGEPTSKDSIKVKLMVYGDPRATK